MPLFPTRELLIKALRGNYALGAFGVDNLEMIQAVVEACEEEKAPFILQISKASRDYVTPNYLKKLIEGSISLSTVPMAVQLDGGDSFELCKECIDDGFTSVTVAHGDMAWERYVALCKKVVEYAHKHECAVEGDLRGAPGPRGPAEAVEFVSRTGVDVVALGGGTAEGEGSDQPFNVERLKAIGQGFIEAGIGEFPITLHAAVENPRSESWEVAEADLDTARRFGCAKVNISGSLRRAFTAAARKALLDAPSEINPRHYLAPARDQVKELVRQNVRSFLGAAGRAF